MTPDRYPSHLRLVGPAAPALTRKGSALAVAAAPRRSKRDKHDEGGVLTKDALLSRLEVVANLGADAPLSFIVVKICNMSELFEVRGWAACDDVVKAVTATLGKLVRATDSVGRLNASTFGLVLQGTGSIAASAVAARLTHKLNDLPEAMPWVEIRVGTATGTGQNANVLPVAAMTSFEEAIS